MNKHVKRKWLKALRSGKYKKAHSKLGKIYTNFPPQYCCLGVLVCEMAPEFVKEGDFHLSVDGDVNYVPDDLAIMWGLDRSTQEVLGRQNDASRDFRPVIDYIERNL